MAEGWRLLCRWRSIHRCYWGACSIPPDNHLFDLFSCIWGFCHPMGITGICHLRANRTFSLRTVVRHRYGLQPRLMPRILQDLPPDKAIMLTNPIGFTCICVRPPPLLPGASSSALDILDGALGTDIDGLMACGDKHPKIASSTVPNPVIQVPIASPLASGFPSGPQPPLEPPSFP